MRKRLFSLVACIFSVLVGFAEATNPFLDLFKNHFKSANPTPCLDNLKSFVGDYVYFNVEDIQFLSNITLEKPDTIWLKDCKSKNPKKNKDFFLCNKYKAVKQGKEYITPSSEFNNKTFLFLSVMGEQSSTVPPYDRIYDLKLQEPETGSILHISMNPMTQGRWKIFSKNTNETIKTLINNKYYPKDKYNSTVTTYELLSGELYLNFYYTNGDLAYEPFARFVLHSENQKAVELIYKSGYLDYSHEHLKFLTKAEHENDLERQRVYEINYERPSDISNLSVCDILPFRRITGRINSSTAYVSQTIRSGYNPLGNQTLPYGTEIYIGDKITVRNVDYYKAAMYGKAFYIECSNVNIENPKSLSFLLSQSQNVRDEFFEFAKGFSYVTYVNALNEANRLMKNGLVVIDARPYDESEYTDGTGMNITIFNSSNKTIKYITFNFIGYNAVGDPVISRGKKLQTFKGIGPIEPDEEVTYNDEYVWFTDIVQSAKLKSIVVQYMNGSTKTFTGNALNFLDETISDTVTNRNPINGFLPKNT